MHRTTPFLLVVGGAFLVVGCSGAADTAQVTGPTNVEAPSAALIVTAPTVSSQMSFSRDCPGSESTTISLNLSVQPRGDGNLTVTRIRLRLDGVGETQDVFPASQVTLTAPVPIVQFGTALAEARQAQTFAVSFPAGCGTPAGSLVATVDARDGRGRACSGEISVPVGPGHGRPSRAN